MPFSLLARFVNPTWRRKALVESECSAAIPRTGRLIGRRPADVTVIGRGEEEVHGSAMSRAARSLARDGCGAPAFAFRDVQLDI